MNTGTITKILGDATLDEFILNADSLNNIVENEELSEILKGYVALSDLDNRDFVTWSQLTSYNPDGANEIDPYFNSWYNSVSVRLNKLLNVDLDAKYAKTTDIPNYETDPKFAEMSGSF